MSDSKSKFNSMASVTISLVAYDDVLGSKIGLGIFNEIALTVLAFSM